jgi:hypothetical protein
MKVLKLIAVSLVVSVIRCLTEQEFDEEVTIEKEIFQLRNVEHFQYFVSRPSPEVSARFALVCFHDSK